MNSQDFSNEENCIPSGSKRMDDISINNNKISAAVDEIHSVSFLYGLTGFSHLFLSLTVIFLSVLGLIRPLWFSIMLTMAASVSTMIAMYFLYTVAFQNHGNNRLLREAMRRIMDAKN